VAGRYTGKFLSSGAKIIFGRRPAKKFSVHPSESPVRIVRRSSFVIHRSSFLIFLHITSSHPERLSFFDKCVSVLPEGIGEGGEPHVADDQDTGHAEDLPGDHHVPVLIAFVGGGFDPGGIGGSGDVGVPVVGDDVKHSDYFQRKKQLKYEVTLVPVSLLVDASISDIFHSVVELNALRLYVLWYTYTAHLACL